MWEWDSTEEFEIERLIGRMVADGSDVPGRAPGSIAAGTVLYRVLWAGWPPEIATWEEEESIPCGEVDFVAQYEAALAAEDAEDAGGRRVRVSRACVVRGYVCMRMCACGMRCLGVHG